jgi:PAS domain S-box-containing protein
VLDVSRQEGRARNWAFFRQAVDQVGTGIAAYDEAGSIHYANRAYAAMLGTTVDDLEGTHITRVNPEFERERFDGYWASFAENETRSREAINRRLDDGTEFPVDVVTTHISVEGEEYHVGTIRDISNRKEYERTLERQNDRLERFGRTVAHDLRNPLNVIEGYLEVAKRADDPSDAHAEIEHAVDRMAVLIDQLLRLAKQGQTVLDPSPVSLESIARSAWETVATGAMTLTVEGDKTVAMDEPRATELFENLFRNSREHGGDDVGVTVGPLGEGFYVADDGPGIPADERDQVLEHGFTTAEDGTGFGLAIVSQIAESHGWTVTVSEGAAGGARFEFRGDGRAGRD